VATNKIVHKTRSNDLFTFKTVSHTTAAFKDFQEIYKINAVHVRLICSIIIWLPWPSRIRCLANSSSLCRLVHIN